MSKARKTLAEAEAGDRVTVGKTTAKRIHVAGLVFDRNGKAVARAAVGQEEYRLRKFIK